MMVNTKIYLDEPDLEYIPSTKGPKVSEFERRIANYLGVSDCVAVNSGTSALFLSLLACGIGPGDEVIVPATTFVATANAVLMTGAKVRLFDVAEKSWCLERFEEKRKTRAIIPVSLYGNSFKLCGIPLTLDLIWDLAEAIECKGARFTNSCYSFNGNKTITTGGGGLITGGNLDKIRAMLDPGSYDSLGYNLGMPALNAYLGCAQLDKIDDYLAKKRRFNEIYREELDGLVTFQEATHGTNPSWWLTGCLFNNNIDIVGLRGKLIKQGIPTRRIFKPLNHYKHLSDGKYYPVAEKLWRHGLCLPSSVRNNEFEIYSVCKAIKEYI